MFDAEDEDFDADVAICRDEACTLRHVHPSHIFSLGLEERPRRRWQVERDPEAYRRPDPKGLRLHIQAVFDETAWPLIFSDVKNAVRNTYGSVSVRSLHRGLRKLVDANFILELDLGFAYAAYIRSSSRFLADPDNLREHIIGKHAPPISKPSVPSQQQVIVAAVLAS